MANTASAILWPTGQPSPAAQVVGSGTEWTFYTQVSVSGPSVCTTVHRGESLRAGRATLTRDDLELVERTTTTAIPTSRRAGRTTANGGRGR